MPLMLGILIFRLMRQLGQESMGVTWKLSEGEKPEPATIAFAGKLTGKRLLPSFSFARKPTG